MSVLQTLGDGGTRKASVLPRGRRSCRKGMDSRILRRYQDVLPELMQDAAAHMDTSRNVLDV